MRTLGDWQTGKPKSGENAGKSKATRNELAVHATETVRHLPLSDPSIPPTKENLDWSLR